MCPTTSVLPLDGEDRASGARSVAKERGHGVRAFVGPSSSYHSLLTPDFVRKSDSEWEEILANTPQPRPASFTPTTSVRVTCDYNTLRDTEPTLPGWGTKNEMCLAGVFVVPKL
jgi:hypothetical protein